MTVECGEDRIDKGSREQLTTRRDPSLTKLHLDIRPAILSAQPQATTAISSPAIAGTARTFKRGGFR